MTKNTANAIRYPATDGKKIVFQAGFNIAIYDPAGKSTKPLALRIDSDRIHAREQRVRLADSLGTFAPGPSAKRIVAEAHGQIVSIPVENGDVRVIENQPGSRATLPVWSPDGKQVAFVSDRSGESEIWLTDAAGGITPRQLTRGMKAQALNLLWSPDGKWLAAQDRTSRTLLIDTTNGTTIVADENHNQASYDSFFPSLTFSPDSKLLAFNRNLPNYLFGVGLFDIAARRLVMVGPSYLSSFSPTFSSDGKYLAYLIERDLNTTINPNLTRKFAFDKTIRVNMVALDPTAPSPFLGKDDEESKDDKKDDKKPVTVKLDGLADRTFEAPIAAGRYSKAQFAGDRLLLLNANEPVAVSGSNPSDLDLLAFDLDKKKVDTITSDVSDLQLSADGKKLLLTVNGKPTILSADSGPSAPKNVDLTAMTLTVQPELEWKQIFEESWRVARDFFYDPGLHGVDWDAVHKKYAARLPMVGDRSDLTTLLKQMVSELNAGHCYVNSPVPGKPSLPMGFLGADYDIATMGVRIAKLYRGDDYSLGLRSPLLEIGLNVKVGDYILAIGGTPITKDTDIQKLLIGTANRTIALTVNDKPSLDGSRIVRVKPLGSESVLRYQDWVAGRDAYVKKYGGPNFGYLHVPDMGAGGVLGFVKGQWQQHDADAVVCDFRYNGGGYVSSMLLDALNTKPWAYWRPRDGGYWTREDWAIKGHLAALCNEFNFSDGELVIETWKHLKLGPVIGKTTGGGEVGSGGGYTLIDGGSIFIPNYAAFTDGRWLVEGHGADPDIEVDQDPAAIMAGRDPQLDKAIELLKAKLAAEPIKKVVHPPFPKKNGA